MMNTKSENRQTKFFHVQKPYTSSGDTYFVPPFGMEKNCMLLLLGVASSIVPLLWPFQESRSKTLEGNNRSLAVYSYT